MAQAVRRLGGEVALVEGAEHVLAREPAPLGEALGEVLRRDGIELVLGAARDRRADATATTTSSSSTTAASCAATACSSRPAGGRASPSIGLETVGVEPDAHGIPVDAHLRAGERLWAIGDVTGIWPLTHVGKYQGDVVAANILGEPREAQLRGGAARRLHRPAGGRGRRGRGPLQRHRPARRAWRRRRPTRAPTPRTTAS